MRPRRSPELGVSTIAASATQRGGGVRSFSALVGRLSRVVRRRLPPRRDAGDLERFRRITLVVESGGLAVVVRGTGSGPQVLDVVGPDGVIDAAYQAGPGQSHRAEVVALVPSTVLEIPGAQLGRALAQDADFAVAALASRARQQALLLRRLSVLRLREPVRRLAGTIALLVEQVGERCPLANGAFLPITQDDLASAADLSRQTANRGLRTLRGARLVHVERQFLCGLDAEGLQAVARGELRPAANGKSTSCKLRHPEYPLNCAPFARPRRRGPAAGTEPR